jgi:hypothetical protein
MAIVFARPPKRRKKPKKKVAGPALPSAIARPKRRSAAQREADVEVTDEILDWFKANIRPRES